MSAPSASAAEEFGGFFDGRGKIGIAEQQDLTLSVQHSISHAVSFAAVSWICQRPQPGIFLRKAANNLRRVVARSVIYNDDFGVPAKIRHVGEDLLQGRAEARGLIVSGDDDAVGRPAIARDQSLVRRHIFRISVEVTPSSWLGRTVWETLAFTTVP